MGRLLGSLAALLALSLVPMGLTPVTAWLVLPAHAALSLMILLGALLAGLRGAGDTARRWGLASLLTTLALVAAMDLASEGAGWWAGPFAALSLWAWIPPVFGGVMGALGDLRSGRLRIGRRRARGAPPKR
ncbi:MAG: hypothetical protein JXX28_01460 [Deltaproteobacteria bacterium]|nr:hypothetical protein [Deltaproteobacteria bacterium]